MKQTRSKNKALVVFSSLVVVRIVPIAVVVIGMGTVIALPSPVVAVSKVAVAGVTVTRIAVTRVAIVIALSVTIPITVLYFVDIVSHLSSVRRSSVLSSVAEAPVHLYTNGPSINLQTAQEIDGILRNRVRFKTTDYPAS